MRLGALGDVVRTLPAASSLRAGYPGAHVAWLVEPRSAGAVEGQPWVDEVIVFPRPALVAALRRGAIGEVARVARAFARRLRSRRFDLAVDFHSIARSALLVRLSGARSRAGYARPYGRELSWVLANRLARLEPDRMSRFERNQLLVRFLGVDAPADATPFRVDSAASSRMAAALGRQPRPVALHAGSSEATPHKRWPPERFAALARALREHDGVSCIVTWGPAHGERAAAEAVMRASDGAARIAPETPSTADLAALLASCRLFVGADTGPLHVASLVGTPVVQLLGPTDAIENAPWSGTPARTLRAGATASMAEIDPGAVQAAASELLAARTARALAGGAP